MLWQAVAPRKMLCTSDAASMLLTVIVIHSPIEADCGCTCATTGASSTLMTVAAAALWLEPVDGMSDHENSDSPTFSSIAARIASLPLLYVALSASKPFTTENESGFGSETVSEITQSIV